MVGLSSMELLRGDDACRRVAPLMPALKYPRDHL